LSPGSALSTFRFDPLSLGLVSGLGLGSSVGYTSGIVMAAGHFGHWFHLGWVLRCYGLMDGCGIACSLVIVFFSCLLAAVDLRFCLLSVSRDGCLDFKGSGVVCGVGLAMV
jgi:hypothetical protein